MSSGKSLKDTVKALNTALSVCSARQPLPDELLHTIEGFLERYSNIDEHDSQRLQDELRTLYTKHVANVPERRGFFISILKHIRPGITGDTRLAEWWDTIIKPTIDAVGHRRDEIDDARDFLLSILVFDADEDKKGEKALVSARFTKRLLDAYLARTKIPATEGELPSPEDEYIAHELESVLIAFGRRMPKELLHALDDIFVTRENRAQALSLLSAYVRVQPARLYLVAETPLIDHLEQCLLIDTSATVVELALTVLIMFLPHITSSLVARLPRLFLVYSRILCWDKLEISDPISRSASISSEAKNGNSQDGAIANGTSAWAKLEQSFDNAESTTPGLIHFFTFLYGLYPLNFMSYIRKPRKFLKSVDFPGAADLELNQDIIRNRTEPFRQVHLLHPNFFQTTVEDELAENRWLKSDPADVVTECMGLCIAVSAALDDPGPPPSTKLPDIPEALVRTEDIPGDSLLTDDEATLANEITSPTDPQSNISWRNTQSTAVASPTSTWYETMPIQRKGSVPVHSHPGSRSSKPASPAIGPRDVAQDSPTLPPQGKRVEPEVKPLVMHRKASGPLRKASSASATSTSRLESFAQALSQGNLSPPPTSPSLQDRNSASLQREIMLLRNDLNFERYLKQQHLSHIGQLQRKHIREATVEAETQNLLNTNRTLKAKLAKANELYVQLKKETAMSKNQSKKWEGELTTKVRAYREEQKQWHSEEDSLRLELQKAQRDCEHLRRLVVESEARELNSQQRLRSLQLDVEELEALRQDVEQLQAKLRQYELRELVFEQAKEDTELLRAELTTTTMKLTSREAEMERARKAYDGRIAELEAQLQAHTQSSHPNQLPPSVQQMIDSALAASHARLQQLKKTHQRLLDKYTDLELRLAELEAEHEADAGPRFPGSNSSGGNFHDIGQLRDVGSTSSFSRKNSVSTSSIGGYISRFPRPNAPVSDPSGGEGEAEGSIHSFSPYTSPSVGPSSSSFPTSRPQVRRHESLPHRSNTGDLSPTQLGGAAAYGESQSQHNPSFSSAGFAAEPVASGKMSTMSGESKPKPAVRGYGRGGAARKTKEKDKDKKEESKPSKSGGFRGLRGIM